MKTDFDVHIHVDLGVTPELVALVNAIIGHRQMPTVEAPQPDPSASEQPQAAAPARKRGRKAAAEAPAAPEQGAVAEGEAPAESEAAPEAEAEAPAESAGPKELTEQDIRDAMHRTRQRIEGENYKDETDGELYQKYHRQLTSWFKNTAALFGADKPSALEGQDNRQAFIAECDRLQVLEDGTIGIPQVF